LLLVLVSTWRLDFLNVYQLSIHFAQSVDTKKS